MSLNHYLEGGKVVMLGTCAQRDPLTGEETPTDPASLIFTRNRGGVLIQYTWPSPASPEVTRLATGVFSCAVEIDEDGNEKWRFETAGGVVAAAEDIFVVDRSVVV